jgi:hypothetical protein
VHLHYNISTPVQRSTAMSMTGVMSRPGGGVVRSSHDLRSASALLPMYVIQVGAWFLPWITMAMVPVSRRVLCDATGRYPLTVLQLTVAPAGTRKVQKGGSRTFPSCGSCCIVDHVSKYIINKLIKFIYHIG